MTRHLATLSYSIQRRTRSRLRKRGCVPALKPALRCGRSSGQRALLSHGQARTLGRVRDSTHTFASSTGGSPGLAARRLPTGSPPYGQPSPLSSLVCFERGASPRLGGFPVPGCVAAGRPQLLVTRSTSGRREHEGLTRPRRSPRYRLPFRLRVIVTPAVYPRLVEFLHFDIQSTGQKSHCVNTFSRHRNAMF